MGKGNKRTIYLGLDYTNFTGGVTEVNRKMQLLDAEFKRAQQEAQNYGNETDKLGLKHDFLKQKIELQTQKVAAAEKAHKEATETNKKSEREIDALTKRVIQEKTSLEKLIGQLRETEEAQDRLNDSTQELDEKMQLLDAEFELAQQRAQNYGNETDRLGVKQDYLKTKIELQTQKVEAAENAHKKALETDKKSQSEIDALAKKILQEKTSLEKLTGQLQETEDAQDKLNDTTRSFGDEIRSLAENLGVNVNPTVEALASKFDGVNGKVGNAIMTVGAIGAVAASVIAPLVKCTVETAAWADELTTLSKTTGVSTTELQKFQYASKQLDVSVDSLSDGLKEITNKIYDAANGSEETSTLFKKLHVSIKDGRGQLKDANEVFYETIDDLGKIKNETQRDAVAMKLFGESARNLNPLIEMGSQKLRELGIEAENMGVIMSETELNGFVKLQDAMDKFNASSEGLKNSLGLMLLPMLTALFDSISSIPVPVLQTITVILTVIATIVAAVKAIKSLTDTGKGIKEFFSTFDIAAHKTTLIILGVVAAIIAVMTLIAVLAGKANDVDRAMSSVGKSVGKMTDTVANVQTATYSAQQHASGTTNFRGGRTWVGEAGPELVELPPGSRITPQAQAGTTEYNTFYITIDAKNVDDFNKVVALAKNQRIAQRRMA